MKIATASTMRSTIWNNEDISLSDLEAKLLQTNRTAETISEYFLLPKERQSQIKDKGGYVGGHLLDGKRHKENVLCRSLLTLDMDYATPETLEGIINKLPFYCYWHTTHKHTPEKPRFRLVIPLSRDVTREEYLALGHMVASIIGIDLFDDSTYEACRVMLWPTTAKDGEFLSGKVEGPMLNPDTYLNMYDNWRDAATWPVSSRMTPIEKHNTEKAADPLEKPGIIGAFCRTYSIQDAIRKFLPIFYRPTEQDDRWDYVNGAGAPGLVIYENKFAYSFHSSDPCSRKILNAFDLVRIHLYRNLDSDTRKGTLPQNMPSFQEMSKLALEDDLVKQTLLNEHRKEAVDDFSATPESNSGWESKLTRNCKTGKIINNIQNLTRILTNDPQLQNFALNELDGCIHVTGPVPWSRNENKPLWGQSDMYQLIAYVDRKYGDFFQRYYEICLSNVVENRRYHPIRDYLDNISPWDGKKRVDDLFIRYLDADDTDYVRQVTRKSFAAAVKRIYEPGCKMDNIIVLDGAQGIGKSSIIRDLVTPEFYSESLTLTDMEDKSGAEKLQGYWVAEIGELAGMKKADIERVKAFISTQDDKYRPSYGRTVESHPRSCTMIATVNGEHGYLRDATGNRRFWVVKLHKKERRKNWQFDDAYRDQFWAEAKAIYRSGEKLFLEGDIAEAAEDAQRNAMEQDDRVGIVEAYLDSLLPSDWETRDIGSRRLFLDDQDGAAHETGTIRRNTVCNAEIWCECFCKSQQDLDGKNSREIRQIM